MRGARASREEQRTREMAHEFLYGIDDGRLNPYPLCRDGHHNGVCDRAADFLRRAGRELQPRGKTKIWPMPSRSSRRAR